MAADAVDLEGRDAPTMESETRAPHVGKLKRRYTDEQAEQARKVKTTYPTWGAVRIAEVVSKTSGNPITRDQVRRILEKPLS